MKAKPFFVSQPATWPKDGQYVFVVRAVNDDDLDTFAGHAFVYPDAEGDEPPVLVYTGEDLDIEDLQDGDQWHPILDKKMLAWKLAFLAVQLATFLVAVTAFWEGNSGAGFFGMALVVAIALFVRSMK